MKHHIFIFVVAAVAIASGCNKLSSLDERLSQVETRVTNLESLCKTLDSDVEAVQLAIAALQSRDYITGVTVIKEDGKVTGYILKFANSAEITVSCGTDGVDGVDGITPQFKIEDGYWYVSYDYGTVWEKAGRATGDDASPILKSVEVTDDDVTFTLQDGTEFSIPRNMEDHINLPNSIILETREIKNVNKGDTVEFNVIVNPSDFTLTKENLSLLDSHHLYTMGEAFDGNASCTLSVAGIRQNETGYEGTYTLSVAISGEGNFFDDITAYVLYGDEDHNDKTRHICSNTSATVSVIPSIQEAFRLETPNQSFYNFTGGITVPSGIKTQYFGMWLNTYKDAAGVSRVYDRSLLTSIKLLGEECSKCCTLSSGKFDETGILEMTLDGEATHWADAVKDYELRGKLFAMYPEGSKISVSRLDKGETAEYSLDAAEIFFKSAFELEKTVDLEELQEKMTVQFDISKSAEAGGYDTSFKKLDNIGTALGYVVEPGGGIQIGYDETNNGVADMNFYNLNKIKESGSVYAWFTRDYYYGSIQKRDGLFYNDSPDQKRYLLYFMAKLTTNLNL